MDIYDFLIETQQAGIYVEAEHAGAEIKFDELKKYINRHVLICCKYEDTVTYKVIFIKNIIEKYKEKWLVYRDAAPFDCYIPEESFDRKKEYHHTVFELV